MSEKDGGFAFTRPDERDPASGEGICQGSAGMTLRQYYEAAAITAAWGIVQSLSRTEVARLSGAISGSDIIGPMHLPRATAEIAKRIASGLLNPKAPAHD